MYIVINNKTDESMVLKTIKQVIDAIGAHKNTIMKNKVHLKWIYGHYTIYNPSVVKVLCEPRGKTL